MNPLYSQSKNVFIPFLTRLRDFTIMLLKKEGADDENAKRIQEIYKLIEQGQEFESLAKQFSEDKSSASKGGKLTPFKSGQLSSVKFEDMAFSMKNEGDISVPFQSDYGWHIIKLYKKSPIEPFEKMKGQLENRVKRDSRSKVIKSAFIESLKDRYGVDMSKVDLDYFTSILDDSYFQRQWKIPAGLPQDKPLFNIEDLSFNYYDFAKYLEMSAKDCKRMALLGYLFDIGMLKVSKDVLNKQGTKIINKINLF